MDDPLYQGIKLLHISCALLSITCFSFRGWKKLNDEGYQLRRVAWSLTHINDSLLIACAVYLAIASQQYPLTDSWLSAKLFALILYIGLGMVVMRFGRNQQQRLVAYLLALLGFAYILAVALSRDPWMGIP